MLGNRFSQYIFCDKNPMHLEALKERATRMAPDVPMAFVPGDANEHVSDIASYMPQCSSTRRVLSFCFVDPFGLDIHFETIRSLGANRAMDFLILLALGMDATRNWKTYVQTENQKVDRFLGDATWRARWREAEGKRLTPIRFLATEYAGAMTKLDYLTTSLEEMIEVRTQDNNMRLYYLAFFSKHEKGYEFWRAVQKYSTEQLGLPL